MVCAPPDPNATVIDAHALPDAHALRERFERREPFRHWVADGFFTPAFAEQLLGQFPPFERGNALNEDGALGGKSTVERIRDLGPAYVALDDLVRGQPFLDWLSSATGIPDLLYDPWYFGGGTHDNRHGQDLDPHVDFNRHPENGWHRRLNLIVYLNHEWDDVWGGSLELHTDPRSPDDQVTLITPLFNRGVLFETTEWSWHGFSRINLPADRQSLSRRSIALYFYTRQRPAEELAPNHSTIYVDRPLPAHIRPGHTLTEADVAELQNLITRRDMHNQRLYRELQQVGAGVGSSSSHVGRLASGLRVLYRRRLVEHQPLDRAAIKSAMLPFVAHLPPALREPLRRAWRRRDEPHGDASPAMPAAEAEAGNPVEECDSVLDERSSPTIPEPERESAVAGRIIGRVAPTHHGDFANRDYALVHYADTDIVRLEPLPSASDLRLLYEESEQFSDDHYTSEERVQNLLAYYGNCLEVFELLPPEGGRCLEVGAGLAWVSRACKERSSAVVTVAQDVSSECADKCTWVDDYRTGQIADLEAEPDFDLISMTHVIEHVPDPADVISELARRLRPGGKLFVTAPYRPKGWTPDDGLQPWLEYSYLHVPAHISYLSEKWFLDNAARCGLELIRWDATQDDHQAFEAILQKPASA